MATWKYKLFTFTKKG